MEAFEPRESFRGVAEAARFVGRREGRTPRAAAAKEDEVSITLAHAVGRVAPSVTALSLSPRGARPSCKIRQIFDERGALLSYGRRVPIKSAKDRRAPLAGWQYLISFKAVTNQLLLYCERKATLHPQVV